MKKPDAWIWEWTREGSEFAHPLMGPAWDSMRPDMHGYDVLHVVMPLNFVVRALFLLRFHLWRWSRFGSIEAWQRWRHRCPHCGKESLR